MRKYILIDKEIKVIASDVDFLYIIVLQLNIC